MRKLIIPISLLITVLMIFAASRYTKTPEAAAVILPEVKEEARPVVTKQYIMTGREVFDAVNEYRRSEGLVPLIWSDRLEEYASVRAEEIVTDWSHDGFFSDDLERNKFQDYCGDCTVMGENLSRWESRPEIVVKDWASSPTHKGVMEGPYKYGAVFVAYDNFTAMIVSD